jgi:hypothetical protein
MDWQQDQLEHDDELAEFEELERNISHAPEYHARTQEYNMHCFETDYDVDNDEILDGIDENDEHSWGGVNEQGSGDTREFIEGTNGSVGTTLIQNSTKDNTSGYTPNNEPKTSELISRMFGNKSKARPVLSEAARSTKAKAPHNRHIRDKEPDLEQVTNQPVFDEKVSILLRRVYF